MAKLNETHSVWDKTFFKNLFDHYRGNYEQPETYTASRASKPPIENKKTKLALNKSVNLSKNA